MTRYNLTSMFIIVLVATLLASNAWLVATIQQLRQAEMRRNEERFTIYAEHAGRAQALIERHRRIIADASDSYRADAYAPAIDRIAEQQLIAAEYQLLLLQIIAQQNAQMIELLAAGL